MLESSQFLFRWFLQCTCYAPLDAWYDLPYGFTCNDNVPSKHPIPVNTSSNSFCNCFIISVLAFLSLSLLGPGGKYLISLLFGKGVVYGLLFKFELLSLFVFVSLLGPGREYLIPLLLTIGRKALYGLLFEFELLTLCCCLS